MKPRIVLTLSAPADDRRQSHQYYRDALDRAGAEVIAVFPGDQPPADYDGLVLAGGGDIDASRYGDESVDCTDVDPARDELELDIVRQAIERDVPVLGICRGLQLLNVVRGGGLVQDVTGHRRAEGTEEHDYVRHDGVRARPGSRLAAAIGEEPLTVNSSHHQAVTLDNLGRDLLPTVEIDGLIEAFEASDRRWVVGVQWHPERSHEVSAEATLIFSAFVAEAARQTTVAG